MKIITSKELAEMEFPTYVTVDADGDFILQPYGYCVERRRCCTKSQLLDWIHHLSSKTWVTGGHIHALIEAWEQRAAPSRRINLGCA